MSSRHSHNGSGGRRAAGSASPSPLAAMGSGSRRPADPGTSVELTQRLLRVLAEGGLRPGQRLPGERALSEQMGVGRTAMREALKSLTVLGFLEVRQGDGTFLTTNTSNLLPRIVEWGLFLGDPSIDALIEARAEVEVSLAGLAARHGDAAARGRVEQFFTFMELATAAEDAERFASADISFHLAIGDASENPVLAGVLVNIRSLLRSWTEKVLASEVRLVDSLELHRPIAEAIRDQDEPAARAAMAAHMGTAVANLRRARRDRPGSP
ncbi:FCD domain-containing protein [Streptomyces sp. SCSIO 75703]|uniref:FadR/GntR family transcriptional regulator n=1 Tax=Streptomyces sp. SCSIO 75703 TaxID=3112165 RepID=UPI0030CEE35A